MKNKKFLFTLLLAIVGLYAMGQVTTSALSGQVVGSSNEPLPGATIIATHVPSGTQYGTSTNPEGRFNLQGMRTGGPYTVEVTFIGYSKETFSEISLFLGQTFNLDVVLKDEMLELSEIVIVGVKSSAFKTDKTGAATNISNEQLKEIPTINRSIEDIARISPFANGMGFAGGDGRSTNFTIDGANFNNNFGLSDNLPGGGNPISLDAIEEVQVVVSPFDIRQTNFIGGGINAITKSGTNKFSASLYNYFTNQNMRGNKIGDNDFGVRDEESKKIYGVTLGGPIIKNKLFFFVNGEFELRPEQVVIWRPSQDGIANTDLMLSRASVSDMEQVKQHLIANYGYDPGSYNDYPADISNRKLLARIDWNINHANKLSLRYNYTMNQSWNPTNGNSTDAGFRNRAMNRISQYSMAFSNSTYSMDNIVNSFSLDLNSRFSNSVSNQFLVTYTKINDMRGSNSEPFPFIDIMYGVNEDDSQILEPYISAGYELFTWNNGVNNNIFNVVDNVNFFVNDHKFTLGANFEYQMANNSYMRNGTGYYRYASLEDFLNQAAPRDFALTYGYAGEKNPAAEVAFNQVGVYAQDEWTVNSKLKFNVGMRVDYLKYVDNIIRNNAIYDLDFGGKKIDTGEWPTAKVQVSPRLGFIWDIKGDQTMKLRGGTGMFAGRLPLVFFTNMPTNSGMVQGSYAAVTRYDGATGIITSVDPNLALLAGPMITDVNQMIELLGLPNTISPEDGVLPRDINGIDPNFKMPQVWKTSLAYEYNAPTSFPLSVTLEGIFTQTLNGVMLKNYNLKQPDESWQRFNGPDDRYIYPAIDDLTYTTRNAYILSNNSDGWGAIGNISIFAEPINNLKMMFAYTQTESKEISGMPGSNAASAYNGLIQINGPHLPLVQRSQFVIPSKAIASVSYRIPYAKDYMATTVNLLYSGYSPYGNSFTYSNDMNGDGIATDLIYIPKEKGDINFISDADENAFFAFVEQDKYLSKHKGEYAEAYAARAPWVNRFDLRFTQDFNVFVSNQKNTIQLTLDFVNFGNLIYSKWGIPQNMYISNNGQILNYEGMDAERNPSFSMATDDEGNFLKETYSTYYNYTEVWYLQIGARYIF
ncbi:MAG TPA: carboxypeptidase regulatory-like domain-containing protein [Tenuifilaceae bacterium]|nr:carboxypeptidase regulatory-like domain-containing protein [Tenuifilaceae bacterium]HPJ45008.1 carboxypeptidase regulatory-like domain-containing protein [Tenuifilaceae bacterium]HPQ35905.1 carboxypeptidase regulatory-like domain-containing protein [Tenuifilaceae bacterium]HRX67132.1 carboxypeptidase regulatory-like domain-containing protein [Tenuifilaceae bacterium]